MLSSFNSAGAMRKVQKKRTESPTPGPQLLIQIIFPNVMKRPRRSFWQDEAAAELREGFLFFLLLPLTSRYHAGVRGGTTQMHKAN